MTLPLTLDIGGGELVEIEGYDGTSFRYFNERKTSIKSKIEYKDKMQHRKVYAPVSFSEGGNGSTREFSIACTSFSLGMMSLVVGESESLEVLRSRHFRYSRIEITIAIIATIDPPTTPPMMGLRLEEDLDF